MKIIFFDLVGGVSGDMLVASLLDAQNNIALLKQSLRKIGIKDVRLSMRVRKAGHIQALQFQVDDIQPVRKPLQFNEIRQLIKRARASSLTKQRIMAVYTTLLKAEQSAHRTTRTHFHQIGEVDSIVDIASVCILLEQMKIDSVLHSIIPYGQRVAPATGYLLKGMKVTFRGYPYENITPTGVALLKTLGEQVDDTAAIAFSITRVGQGAGSIQNGHSFYPNIVRALVLESITKKKHRVCR